EPPADGVNDLAERAQCASFLGDAATAAALAERILAVSPEDAYALFLSGKDLLTSGDDAGLDRLTRAVEVDADATPAATAVAQAYLVRSGRYREAHDWDTACSDYHAARAEAAEERSFMRHDEDVAEHGLPDEGVAA